jgi:hypothetical protein
MPILIKNIATLVNVIILNKLFKGGSRQIYLIFKINFCFWKINYLMILEVWKYRKLLQGEKIEYTIYASNLYVMLALCLSHKKIVFARSREL